MLFPCVNFELGEHLPGKTILGEHPLTRVLDDEIRLAGLHLRNAEVFFATYVTTVEHILLLLFLLTGQDDLVGIDDNYEIARVHMGRVSRLVPTS